MSRRFLLGLALACSACQLSEVTVDIGGRTVVVQSVLSRPRPDQFVVLEYAFNGDTSGRLGASNVIPPGRPQIPVSGAFVTLTNEGPGPCSGRVDTLRERITGGTTLATGTYSATGLCALVPGARVRLHVTTPEGQVAEGATVVPGVAARSVVSGGREARFVLDTLPIWRERDTVRIAVGAMYGRGLQIEVRRAEIHSDLSMYLFSDSLGVAMPGTLVNPFKADGVPAFRPGRYYLLTVALADTNYFDFIRSLSDPITGRGFLNHLSGAIGVFGSVDVEQYLFRVVGDQYDAREGTYRLTGRVGTVNVDFILEAYLSDDPELEEDEFSALVSGRVQDGLVSVSGDGTFGFIPGSGGEPNQDAFQFAFQVIRSAPPRFRQYNLRGIRSTDGSPFPVELAITNQGGATVARSTLTAQQVSGPNGGH